MSRITFGDRFVFSVACAMAALVFANEVFDASSVAEGLVKGAAIPGLCLGAYRAWRIA